MKLGLVFGIACAVVLHVGVILFGGILFLHDETKAAHVQDVELLAEDAPEKEKPKEEPAEPKPEELASEAEAPPDAAEIVKSLEIATVNDGPALDAASLSAIEAALNGSTPGGGDFAESVSLASGGRIGALGKGMVGRTTLEDVFNPADIDQKPRAVFQSAPIYPADMRGKKLEGVVTVIFVVDSGGKVSDPRVESSSNNAFERPALEAIRRWKFEPGIKGGERVPCRMRIPIRFQPS